MKEIFNEYNTKINVLGKYFTTIRCVNGEWSEIFHKEIDQAFPKAMIDPDSVDMSSSNNEIQYDNTYVLLFYRQQYLACSVLGDSVSIFTYLKKKLFSFIISFIFIPLAM